MGKRCIALLLMVSMVVPLLLTGCDLPRSLAEMTGPDQEKGQTLKVTSVQLNSIHMLNYLAYIAEEIYVARDNRVILEDIYSALMNELNPGTIDEITQNHLRNLRSTIKQFLQIETKRDRLQYIYDQEKAAAIRSAIPESMESFSITEPQDWIDLTISLGFTVVDAYNGYQLNEDVQQAERDYMTSGWKLGDEEEKAIRQNRENAFDYMVDIVQKYGTTAENARELGMLTLNEKAVADFVQICASDEAYRKIQFLEASRETYCHFGKYYLELAESYYETGAYQQCLDCVEAYEQLPGGIFRQDFNIVPVLPKAVAAAREVYTGEDYVAYAQSCAQKIVDNTPIDNWSMRYFAAQVYVELYTLTQDEEHLWTAYELVKNNVSQLVDVQCALNETYLAQVENITAPEPDYTGVSEDEKKDLTAEYQAEKKRVDAYNKSMAQQRKTQLPPVYEPLTLNCELLFALANKLHVGFEQQKSIHKMLQTETCGVFLSRPVNARYSFSSLTQWYDMHYGAEEMVIPANLLTPDAAVTVTVEDSGGTTQIDDYALSQVQRNGATADTFEAHYTSSQIKKVQWSEDAGVTVSISYGEEYDPLTFQFRVSEYVDNFLDKVQ